MPHVIRMPFVVIAVLVAGVVGLLMGGRVPLGQVPLMVESGVVLLHEETWVSFDGEDGTQLGFDVASVRWSANGQRGEGEVAPCLREGKQVPAEVGYRWVRLPDGGARPFALWLRC